MLSSKKENLILKSSRNFLEQMHFKTSIEPYTLQFKKPAGTSRGVYQIHKVWFVRIFDPDNVHHLGVGECAPLPDLSCDALPTPDYESILLQACRNLELSGRIDDEALRPYPSILFGLETAVRHFERGSYALWDTPFSRGEKGILINGLIWMGEYRQMAEQIEEKIRLGFTCIKLKIGAINFEEELDLLKRIRQRFTPEMITLRVDANGGFTPGDASSKLQRLSELNLHSIEQPIHAGQRQEMAGLTSTTPLPIALDEELIGCNDYAEKRRLLQDIKPQFIILKPSLHGGFSGCTEWIELAESLHIGWWITSALESNVGLNAIAQWAATWGNPMPQGLGTGLLYTNNIEMPLHLEGEYLWYKP
jgi:o-succinylbenzoate synthase